MALEETPLAAEKFELSERAEKCESTESQALTSLRASSVTEHSELATDTHVIVRDDTAAAHSRPSSSTACSAGDFARASPKASTGTSGVAEDVCMLKSWASCGMPLGVAGDAGAVLVHAASRDMPGAMSGEKKSCVVVVCCCGGVMLASPSACGVAVTNSRPGQ